MMEVKPIIDRQYPFIPSDLPSLIHILSPQYFIPNGMNDDM